MKTRVWRSVCVLAGLMLLPSLADAQFAPGRSSRPQQFEDAVLKIEATCDANQLRRGQAGTCKLSMELAPTWHTYPTAQTNPVVRDSKNDITFSSTEDIVFLGPVKNPATHTVGAGTKNEILFVEAGEAVWEQQFLVRPNAQPGKKKIKVTLKAVVCQSGPKGESCLPPNTREVEAEFYVTDEPPQQVDPRFAAALRDGNGPAAPASGPPAPAVPVAADANAKEVAAAPIKAATSEQYRAGIAEVQAQLIPLQTEDEDLLAFVLAGVFWGAVSLVTPCVFPMIPITVSYFLKQSEKSHHKPLTMATVYCGTIVVVLTVAAVVLLSFFRMLSVNPWMNIGIGLLFVVFALSLFGMYDIELPSGLAQYTSSREGKGGLLGTMFMALTFTILSFACVAPFLGGFGGTAASAKLGWGGQVLGALAFAATFAAPFFLLALFPTLLRKLPKSGSWLNSVKVVMGFIELAAAMKFFRLGELVLRPQGTVWFTFDLVMGIWVALSILCGLYLLNAYRLPHDTPTEHLGVPRLLFAVLFLGLGFYLMPALFKFNSGGENQRPDGVIYAWVDSFLLPEPRANKGSLAWAGDLKQVVDDARAQRQRTGERKLVFIDMTGVTCVNCRINENDVFAKTEFKDLLAAYSLVQLYTDTIPTEFYAPTVRAELAKDPKRQERDASTNLKFQRETFGTEQLPLYVILEPLPNGKVQIVGIYDEGKINDKAAFAKFLKEPLTGSAARLHAQVGIGH